MRPSSGMPYRTVLNALIKILIAALVSRHSTNPQLHLCVLMLSVFLTSLPQFEQFPLSYLLNAALVLVLHSQYEVYPLNAINFNAGFPIH